MLAGLIDEKRRVCARRDLSGDFGQVQVHGLRVASGHDEGCTCRAADHRRRARICRELRGDDGVGSSTAQVRGRLRPPFSFARLSVLWLERCAVLDRVNARVILLQPPRCMSFGPALNGENRRNPLRRSFRSKWVGEGAAFGPPFSFVGFMRLPLIARQLTVRPCEVIVPQPARYMVPAGARRQACPAPCRIGCGASFFKSRMGPPSDS